MVDKRQNADINCKIGAEESWTEYEEEVTKSLVLTPSQPHRKCWMDVDKRLNVPAHARTAHNGPL